MRKIYGWVIYVFLFAYSLPAQSIKIIESSTDYIKLEVSFEQGYKIVDTLINGLKHSYINSTEFSHRVPGEPWIPQFGVSIGVPSQSKTSFEIISVDQKSLGKFQILPYPSSDEYYSSLELNSRDKNIYSANFYFPNKKVDLVSTYQMRFATIQPILFSPFQYNPTSRELIKNNKIVVKIKYDILSSVQNSKVDDPLTNEYLKTAVINFDQAKNWTAKSTVSSRLVHQSWYNPDKKWYKIYLKEKGLYRLTHQELLNAGVILPNTIYLKQLELFNNGLQIPLEVVDNNNDSIFSPGDYINFIGYPVKNSPYNKGNIYNLSNVYWLSFEGDTAQGLFYKYKDAFPIAYQSTIQQNLRTDLYEVDSLFEPLGYAPDDQRDYWYWGTITGQSGNVVNAFRVQFQPFKRYEIIPNFYDPYVLLRVNMHGMTDFSCNYAHIVKIYINDKYIGTAQWNRQESYTFEKYFYVSNDSIPIYSDGNTIRIETDGNICHPSKSDVVKINWFEFTYRSSNLVGGDYLDFKSTGAPLGFNRYWVWEWTADTMLVYVPERNTILTNPQILKDVDKTVLFVDSVDKAYEYFCVVPTYYKTVDSIRYDIPSNYRSPENAADYLIITHPKFNSIAQRLATIRSENFPDKTISNPRIFIADIFQIYDEFSDGLMDPYAIRDFIKYAFENWRSPTLPYVVLIGDMSHDYRKLLTTSRENFIPSIPYHSYTYGQAPSDNGFVAIVGNDVVPDLAIGRISIETIQQGNAFLDKLETYPNDESKKWRETILLISSGIDADDELRFGFNDASYQLRTSFLEYNGLNSKMVMRYPNKPQYFQYQGSTIEIRKAFNEGAVIANYYGHGGGSQWDLTFLNDDIYLLQNGGRLPLVLSVTCYTAHFSNQDVFGEQFNKVPGKGSIGFFGSSGLTHWEIGKYINNLFFDEVFNRKNTIIGKVILNAKARVISPYGYYANQIALLSYLGDPVLKVAIPTTVDFVIKGNDIMITPQNPLVGDSVLIKAVIYNYGINSPEDSVTIQLNFSSQDTSGIVGNKKLKVFGEKDSVQFYWTPTLSGLYELTVRVNYDERVEEEDLSDNIASATLAVFNISEPSIVSPNDGYSTSSNIVQVFLSDIGYYVDKQLKYEIEIDTSIRFINPIKSGMLSAQNGLLKWLSPPLNQDEYYWRTRIYDGVNLGRWSQTRTFAITDETNPGYYVGGKQLDILIKDNVNYISDKKVLTLNTSINPPKPSEEKWIEDVNSNYAFTDSMGLSCLTTDGKYFYVGNLWYFASLANQTGNSLIYRIGTGNEGTIKGEYYGTVPNFYDKISFQMFVHGDGYLYVPFGNAHKLIRINLNATVNNIDTVIIPAGLIRKDDARVADGDYYLTSDSQYVYNLAIKDSLGQLKYTLRVLDPSNNWSLVKDYYYENLNSYLGFTSFFVANGYFYPYENFYSGFIRRIRIEDGYFDADWFTWDPRGFVANIKFYAWTYDWKNDHVYATQFKYGNNLEPKIAKFVGKYVDATGTVLTQSIGPAFKWLNLKYDIVNNSSIGNYHVNLEGLNKNTRLWDTLATNIPPDYSISNLDANLYNFIRVKSHFVDSSFTTTQPIELRSINVNYLSPPELNLVKESISFTPDSLLQGFNLTMNFKIDNIGKGFADSTSIKFYMEGSDSVFASTVLNVPPDSSSRFSYTIPTSNLIFDHSVKAIANFSGNELFTFNNIASNSFFVARDSINPSFNVVVDGKEIINGDLVSKNPLIRISVKDNSPLPLDTTHFTIIHKNIPLSFSNPDLTFSYSPYPNSEAVIEWKPSLTQGRHIVDILAKDASGNFFDTTFHRLIFFVYDEDDIAQMYNYPNPFKDNTYFTFELRGSETPEEIRFRVYTIAGRLIKEIKTTPEDYRIGFNSIYWDGKDADGDNISNGTYLVKLIAKYKEKTKTEILKLAKIR
ncbi:MAG: hypothetical protein KF721_07670 [Ignavibacteriaceae bacterium]|nr:hypothetical protein [Ignavibacteriaceae bacterium]